MTIAIGYTRVSTEEQARGDKTSLEDQRAAIQALAARLGAELGEVFEDAGVSGGTDQRPGFRALLAYCQGHPRPRTATGLVLALNASRWGRFEDTEESAYWRVLLRKLGWIVRYAEHDIDDPMARGVLRSIIDTQATAYREAIRANARRGGRSTAQLGYWQCEAPIGYRRQAVDPAGRTRILEPGQRKADSERVRLVPGPAEEVELVQACFTRYAAGASSYTDLVALGRRHFPAKRWSRGVVRQLLRNPTYLGEIHYGRRDTAPIVVPGAHPALVERAVFERVQAIQVFHGKQHRRANAYPLSGLITCAHCGDVYTGGGGPKGPPDDPERYRFYRHRVHGLSQPEAAARVVATCPAAYAVLPRRVVEPAVLGAIADTLDDPRVHRRLAEVLDRALGGIRRPGRTGSRRAELVRRRDRLVNLAAAGTLRPAEIEAQMAAIRAELEALDQAQQAERFAARRAAGLHQERDRLLALAKDFRQAAQRLTGAALRELVRPWIASAVADRVAATLTLAIRALPEHVRLATEPERG